MSLVWFQGISQNSRLNSLRYTGGCPATHSVLLQCGQPTVHSSDSASALHQALPYGWLSYCYATNSMTQLTHCGIFLNFASVSFAATSVCDHVEKCAGEIGANGSPGCLSGCTSSGRWSHSLPAFWLNAKAVAALILMPQRITVVLDRTKMPINTPSVSTSSCKCSPYTVEFSFFLARLLFSQLSVCKCNSSQPTIPGTDYLCIDFSLLWIKPVSWSSWWS